MKLSKKIVARFLMAMTVAVGVSAAAQAAPINYGDFAGNTVLFKMVTEDSSTDAGPLYGAPIISADTLVFSPATFGAFAGGGASDYTQSLLTTMLQATPGNAITAINLHEAGDYTLVGVGTPASMISINVPVVISVVALNGVAVSPINFFSSMTIAPDSSFEVPGENGVGVIWSGTLNFDLSGALADAQIEGQATKLNLSMDNQLAVITESGTVGHILKKNITVGAESTVAVPLPMAAPAGMALLAGIGLIRRYRNRR